MKLNISHLTAREVGSIIRHSMPLRFLPRLCIEVNQEGVMLKTEETWKQSP